MRISSTSLFYEYLSLRVYTEEQRERNRQRAKKWRVDNPERAKEQDDRERKAYVPGLRNEYQKAWRETNAERHKQNGIAWRKVNRKRDNEKTQAWRKNNAERYHANIADRTRVRYRTDPQFNLKRRCQARLRSALLYVGVKKTLRTSVLLGCDSAELKAHIENQFTDGMTWDNRHLWELDHIIEISKFDLTDEGQQRQCFHYTNLRPLWKEDNRSRPNRFLYPDLAA